MIRTMRYPTVFTTLGLAVVSLTMGIQVARAQTGGAAASVETGLEEVTVTAQRREENIQSVPVAVTAISAAQLEQLNITDSLGFARLVPNMFASANTGLGTGATYSIRGLNNTESIPTFDLPVGTYIDDIFVARQNANNFSLFDVDHVEVLSGPQGTLFGRNTTGGAVSISLKKPSEEFGGFVETSLGSFEEHSLRASVDIPISPTLLTKFTGFWKDDNGFVRDVTTNQTLNGDDAKGFRAALRWLPTSDLTWDLSGTVTDEKYSNVYNDPLPNGDRVSYTGLNTDYAVYPTLFTGPKGKLPLENLVLETSVTSNFAWKTGIGTVNFITGYRDLEQKFSLEFFDSPLPVVESAGANGAQLIIANSARYKQITQEIKLNGSAFGDRLNYVTGFFYFNESDTTDIGTAVLLAGGILPNGVCLANTIGLCSIGSTITGNDATNASAAGFDRVLFNTTHSSALYGQGDYKITDQLIGTVGARFTDETKGIEYTPNNNPNFASVDQFNTADMVAAGIPVEQSIKIVTPRFAVRYDFTPDLNVYTSATRGFKGGGWNARADTANLALPFAPEKTWSYELGMKSEWLEHKLRANLTGFYSDTKDFQLPSAYVPPGASAPVFVTENFAGLVVYGLEGEFAAAPIEGLNLFANIGIQSGHYTDLAASVVAQQKGCLAAANQATSADCAAGIVTPTGGIAEPVRLPKHQIKAGASYVIRLGAADLTPNFTVENSGAYDVETSNDSPNEHSDGYTLYNAGLTLSDTEGPKQRWNVQVGCQNCSNQLILAGKLPPTLYYQDPRRWSLVLHYKF